MESIYSNDNSNEEVLANHFIFSIHFSKVNIISTILLCYWCPFLTANCLLWQLPVRKPSDYQCQSEIFQNYSLVSLTQYSTFSRWMRYANVHILKIFTYTFRYWVSKVGISNAQTYRIICLCRSLFFLDWYLWFRGIVYVFRMDCSIAINECHRLLF